MGMKVLTYIAETIEPNLRGSLASTSTLTIFFGLFTQFLMGTFCYWRTVALINIAVPIIAMLLLFIIPESPHWLILNGRTEEARQSLAWLRGWTTEDKVDGEFQELCKALGKSPRTNNLAMEEELVVVEKPTNMKFLKRFGTRDFLLPFSLVSYLYFVSYFIGIGVLQTFAVQIFQTLKSPIDKYYATVILGIMQLSGALICTITIHWTGKRPLAFFSVIGTGICFITVATYAYLFDINSLITGSSINSNSTTNLANSTIPNSSGELEALWLPTTLLLISAFIFHTGIKSIPWILISEVFPNDIRNIASGLTAGVAYILAFIANKTFLSMVDSFTFPGTFWFYGAMGLINPVILYFVLPETEGRSLTEIENHFSGKCKLGKRERRTNVKKGETNPGFSDDCDL